MDWVIDTQGLSKTYGKIKALKSLTLQVPKNSIFGFLGPNGAGKTTTIKLLLGLIAPTAGSARVFGLDIRQESVAVRARVGYLPQDPRFYEYMTARQILDYVAHYFFKGPQSEIDQRVAETLELVGLADKADRPIKGFSGGERQRLGIAQAQVNYPDLLILDEPAASLDPMGRRDVLEVMERLRKYTTIFYCTHILDDVQRVSDTVAILNRGEMAAYGPIGELLAGEKGVTYEVKVKGEGVEAVKRLKAQPWVTEIKANALKHIITFEIGVSDPAAAEAGLFRLFASMEGVTVTDFHVREHTLEDVFLNIIEGDQHGNRK